MSELDAGSITALLRRLNGGDDEARRELLIRLAFQMQPIARGLMGREAAGHTLQPTALVNEALVRLVQQGALTAATNRAYLYGAAANAMRQVLVDHARAEGAQKRGGELARVPLADLAQVAAEPTSFGLVELNDAIEELAKVHQRASHVVTLRFLAGYGMSEIAEALGVALSTAETDWRFARAWLLRALSGEKKSDSDQGP